MSYGNTSELWIVGRRAGELKYPPEVFTSERAARDWATQNATRTADYAIYKCDLIGLIVIDSPRWIDHRPQPADSAGASR